MGHRISEAGIGTDPAKIEAVTNWPRPTTLKELRSYLGFCSYYRRYVPHFTQRAKPLHQLVTKLSEGHPRRNKRMKIQVGEAWQPEHQEAFEDLKSALTSAPTLAFPRYGSPFILEVDGSDRGLGAVSSPTRVEDYAEVNATKPITRRKS